MCLSFDAVVSERRHVSVLILTPCAPLPYVGITLAHTRITAHKIPMIRRTSARRRSLAGSRAVPVLTWAKATATATAHAAATARAGRPSPTRPRAATQPAAGRPPTRERRGRRRSRPARPGASETAAVGEDVSFPRSLGGARCPPRRGRLRPASKNSFFPGIWMEEPGGALPTRTRGVGLGR